MCVGWSVNVVLQSEAFGIAIDLFAFGYPWSFRDISIALHVILKEISEQT